MAGTKCRRILATPPTLISMTFENSASEIRHSLSFRLITAALFNSRSGAPCCIKMSVAHEDTCVSLVTSTARRSQRDPIWARNSRNASLSLEQPMTRWPRFTKPSTSARPSPRDTPVIRIVRDIAVLVSSASFQSPCKHTGPLRFSAVHRTEGWIFKGMLPYSRHLRHAAYGKRAWSMWPSLALPASFQSRS